MKNNFFSLMMVAMLVLTACASPANVGTTQPSFSDQVATMVAATMQALLPSTASAPPVAPTQVPAISASTGQSAIVAFVKDGNIEVWEEASSQSKTIFSSSDVIAVSMSDDSEILAFLRRSQVKKSEQDFYEQSALWAVERDGENPRELVPAEELRRLLNASETDSTNILQMEWIPNTHLLLFSGYKYIPGADTGAPDPPEGLYRVDADTLERVVLIEAGNNLRFAPSPDGKQIALLSTTSLGLINIDGSNWRQAMLTYPARGVPRPDIPRGVWTRDSSAFLVAAPSESEYELVMNFMIWRVPVNGSPAESLAAITNSSSSSITFSPGGSSVAFYSVNSLVTATQSAHFIIPLTPDAGSLAVPKSIAMDARNLHWSPAGGAYAIHEGRLDPLCPDAAQDVEVCGKGHLLGDAVTKISWVDGNRFLFLSGDSSHLYFGKLDGTQLRIAGGVENFAAAAITCQNDAELVAGGQGPAYLSAAHGMFFVNSWRIRNTGTCAWDASYRLAFVDGERMNGPRGLDLGETVPPGGEIELSVNLIAPADHGTYQGEWWLFDPDGNPFGVPLAVELEVPSFTVTELRPDQVVAKIPGGEGNIARGEGALWQMSGNAVSRIDLDTNQVVASIPVGEFPTALATGYGAVWTYANGAIHRIDPQTNQVNGTLPLAASSGLHCLITGAGSVWACSGAEGLVYRIDPTTIQVIATIPVEPGALGAATTENAVWVVDPAGLKRIDLNTNEVTAAIPLDCSARKLAVNDTTVWVLCYVTPTLLRIDPLTNQVVARIGVGTRPRGVALDSNAVWVTAQRLIRIDPATNQVKAVYQVGDAPVHVIVAQGELFVTTQSEIWRIRP